jgi:carbon-monoxide dehydrogenase large subunit
VRWPVDRLEDLTSTTHGFDEIVDAELGLDKERRILVLATEVIGDIGAYSIASTLTLTGL